MDRVYELTYLCGHGEGQFAPKAHYERLAKINAAPFETQVQERVCAGCRRKPADFNSWSWKAVAPKRVRASGGVFDEMMMFLADLVPELDDMAVADEEVVVNRTASQLRIDGFQLSAYARNGEVDVAGVPEKVKRDIVKLVRSQMDQLQRQQQKQKQKRDSADTIVEEGEAVCVDVRRAAPRVVQCKPSKAHPVKVGGAGFF